MASLVNSGKVEESKEEGERKGKWKRKGKCKQGRNTHKTKLRTSCFKFVWLRVEGVLRKGQFN